MPNTQLKDQPPSPSPDLLFEALSTQLSDLAEIAKVECSSPPTMLTMHHAGAAFAYRHARAMVEAQRRALLRNGVPSKECQSTTLERIKTLLADRLRLDKAEIKLESRFIEDLGADSLETVEIIMACEECWNIKIPDENSVMVESVSDLVNLIDWLVSENALVSDPEPVCTAAKDANPKGSLEQPVVLGWARKQSCPKGTNSMNAIELIKAERERQVSAEGYTSEHDDSHRKGEMAAAAACYAMPLDVRPCEYSGKATQWIPIHWPWSYLDWRPSPFDRVRELVKAGALIVAEIERLQRAGAVAPAHPQHNDQEHL